MTATPPTAASPMLELSRVVKSFGAVVALRSGTLSLEPARSTRLVGENGAGKSTLVKIIAGLYRRDAGEFLLDGEAVDFTLDRRRRRRAGIAVIYQEPTLFPDLSVTENIFMGRQPARRASAVIDRTRDARRGDSACSSGSACASTPTARPSASRSPTSRSSRSRRPSRSTPGCSSWMSRPPRCRGVEVDRLFAVARAPARRGPRPPVHLAPLRRGVRALRHRHGHARRRLHRDERRSARRPSTSSCARWSAATSPTLFPKQRGRDRRTAARGRGPHAAGRVRRHLVQRPRRRDRRPRRPRRRRAAARSPAPSSASTRYDSGSVTIDGRPVPPARPAAAPCAPGSRSCPRIGASRDSCSSSTVARNVDARDPHAARDGSASSRTASRTRRPRVWASRLEVKTGALDTEVGTLSRRQPAEGRARASGSRPSPTRADRRRADPRHRRRHQGRGAPPALGARRPRHGRSS